MAKLNYPRLDDDTNSPAVLTAGSQIINSKKNSRLQGLSAKGRTFIDLLGGAGSGESLAGWVNVGNTVTISSTQKRSSSSSFKVSPDASKSSYIYRDFPTQLEPSQQYVLVGWVYVESFTSGGAQEVSLRDVGTFTSRYPSYFGSSQTIGSWQPFFIKIQANNKLVGKGFRLLVGAGSAQVNTMYFDEIRLYAVSATDYAAIGTTITGEAIDRLLSYASPGISGVDGLWIRRYGRNQINVQAYSNVSGVSVNGLGKIKTIGSGYYTPTDDIKFLVMPNSILRFSAYQKINQSSSGVFCSILFYDNSEVYKGEVSTDILYADGTVFKNFTVPALTSYISIRFARSGIIRNYDIEYSDIQLELVSSLSDVGTAFQPREDSLIAFSGVELHANPNDGTEPDVLREVNGRYEVTKLWRKMTLDGSLAWFFADNQPGIKTVRCVATSFVPSSIWITKFNGKLIDNVADVTQEDFWFDVNNNLRLTIPSVDSGWGDSYTPSQAEIQAYFNGYQMGSVSGATFTTPYISGTKAWRFVTGDPSTGTSTLPTTLNPGYAGWQPYQLLYRLSSVTTETVQEDGALSLLEGDNFIEVGNGYVSREKAPKPFYEADRVNFGNNAISPDVFKFPAKKVLSVYGNGLLDSRWKMYHENITSNGDIAQLILPNAFDPTLSYSISYLKRGALTGFPNITGSVSTTEESQLRDLTDGITEVISRVSVVEATKSDVDEPIWITPTLLNGWVHYGNGWDSVGYYKDSLGIVRLKGLTSTGAINTSAFVLPPGYRPKNGTLFCTISDDQSGRIDINAGGAVNILVRGISWVSFEGISFLAEQ